jgi:LysM repeat protein
MVSAPAASWGEEFLLYTPKQAAGDQVPAAPDQGVLVRKITVKRGDTLRNLSREHLGVASWFPQVLLFNSIKNPDLIHPGEKLLVPVPAGHAISVKKSARVKRHHVAKRPSSLRKSAINQVKPETRAAMPEEPETYQRAKRAYLNGDYQKALGLFGQFLRKHPQSSFAADASLYRADCLLRLSGE